MAKCCPYCNGTGWAAAPDTSAAEIAAIAEGLRAACQAAGAGITGDGRVSEETAALLIGREIKTLRNWRYEHRPIPFAKRARRISYAVTDIARWMHSNSEAARE